MMFRRLKSPLMTSLVAWAALAGIPAAALAQAADVSTASQTESATSAAVAQGNAFSHEASVFNETAQKLVVSSKFDSKGCMSAADYETLYLVSMGTLYGSRNIAETYRLLEIVQYNMDCVEDQALKVKFYVLIGAAAYEDGDEELCNRSLNTAVQVARRNGIKISTDLLYYSDSIQEKLDLIEKDLNARGFAIKTEYVPSIVEKHPLWLSFIPFGAGLFDQHNNIAGAVYASSQAAGIILAVVGSSIVHGYLNSCKHCQIGHVYPDDLGAAQRAQNTLIAGITISGASYVASVIHALITHQDVTVRELPSQKTAPVPDDFVFTPTVTDGGAGFFLSTSF